MLDNGYTLEFTPSSPWTPGALIQWWTNATLLDSTYETPITAGFRLLLCRCQHRHACARRAGRLANVRCPAAALNSIVDLQFNVPLNPSTVNSTNIYLYDSSTGLHVSGTYTMPQANEVRIVPSANFTASHNIYVYVTNAVQSTTSVPFHSTT